MILSLLLSILGLIAMSSYYADESSKDIAVRKVFGSTIEQELWKTVMEYLVLLGLAAIIAIPISIRLASRLLEQYSYRISGYGWVFVVTVLIATMVAFLSILWQTLKAARTNPAEELKKEYSAGDVPKSGTLPSKMTFFAGNLQKNGTLPVVRL